MANRIQAELLIICVVPTMVSKSSVMELWKWVKTRVTNQTPQNQTANPSSQTELADNTTNSTIPGGVYVNSQAMKYGTGRDNERGRNLDLSGGSSTNLKGPSSSVELGWSEDGTAV
jgi:hypothetical protein